VPRRCGHINSRCCRDLKWSDLLINRLRRTCNRSAACSHRCSAEPDGGSSARQKWRARPHRKVATAVRFAAQQCCAHVVTSFFATKFRRSAACQRSRHSTMRVTTDRTVRQLRPAGFFTGRQSLITSLSPPPPQYPLSAPIEAGYSRKLWLCSGPCTPSECPWSPTRRSPSWPPGSSSATAPPQRPASRWGDRAAGQAVGSPRLSQRRGWSAPVDQP